MSNRIAMSLILSALAVGASPLPTLAESALVAECRQMAQEDGIPADEIADYIAECVAAIEEEGAGEVEVEIEAESVSE